MIETPTSVVESPEPSPETKALVEQWTTRITCAKEKWKEDFKRMRENMEFVSGLQWPGQTTIDTDKYVCNITLRDVNQKVASLYAKNPTAVATRRPRLDFAIWNGETESLMEAIQQAQQIVMSGQPLPPDLSAFFQDVEDGRLRQQIVDKIGKTLEIVYGHSVDSQKPEFKEQLKQAVRRVIVCGVAYGRPVFCRETSDYSQPSSIDARSGANERAGRAQAILNKVEDGTVEQDSATTASLKSLVASLGVPAEPGRLPERLEFDFCQATAIIPDERCRSLVDFVAARWIAQEYVLPVEEVNAIFGTKITIGSGTSGGATTVTVEGKSNNLPVDNKADILSKNLVYLYEVFNYVDRTRFFICEGWKDFVLAPEAPLPQISGFWHHFAVTFNSIECDPDSKTSIFPPSDVQTVKSTQREWNRVRQDLRDHRRANSPRYIYRDGTISTEDLIRLTECEPNGAVALKGVPVDMDINTVIRPMVMNPITPEMYETASLEQDMMMGGGFQQANIGAAQPNVTATVGSIAEQSRLNVSASNIDDLDGFLSRLAQAGGEMLLQEMSEQTVKRIAGVGAVWPSDDVNREDYLNEIYLKIEAASSGRPNKAVDVQNGMQILPLIQQAGGNPIGVIEELAKRLDDNIDITKFFPLSTPPVVAGGSGASPQSSGGMTGGTKSPPSNPPKAPSRDGDAGSGVGTPPNVALPI